MSCLARQTFVVGNTPTVTVQLALDAVVVELVAGWGGALALDENGVLTLAPIHSRQIAAVPLRSRVVRAPRTPKVDACLAGRADDLRVTIRGWRYFAREMDALHAGGNAHHD
jgi:hypothetical protein